MKKTILNTSEINNIITLYQNGKSLEEIKELTNISIFIIKRTLKENGIKIRKAGGKYKGGKSASNKRYNDTHKNLCKNLQKKWKEKNKDKIQKHENNWRKRKQLEKLNSLIDLSFEDVISLNKKRKIVNIPIKHKSIIISKKFLSEFKNIHGKEELKKQIPEILTFLRKYHPGFPFPPQEEELNRIIDVIKNYDYSKLYWDELSFKNSASSIGNNYLKHF